MVLCIENEVQESFDPNEEIKSQIETGVDNYIAE